MELAPAPCTLQLLGSFPCAQGCAARAAPRHAASAVALYAHVACSVVRVGLPRPARGVPRRTCNVPCAACGVPHCACSVQCHAREVPRCACSVPRAACGVPHMATAKRASYSR
eukprot:356333-Chlamydomonas_euryale.AAC.4